MESLWKSLQSNTQRENRPIFALAPMYDVTDVVFREIVREVAKPDIFFTEFVHCEAILSGKAEVQLRKLDYKNDQRPVIAQIWGTKPETFLLAAQALVQRGFDGIDINMGCPEKSVLKTGACAALIKNPSLASDIIKATQQGAQEIPVSVKTRLGFSAYQTEEWIPHLLSHNLAALTVHGRTVADMSINPANWAEIAKSVSFKNDISPNTVLLGNGDVESYTQGQLYKEKYGVDGVMIGRGIFKNIRVFSPDSHRFSLEESLKLLVKHTHMYEDYYGAKGNFNVLKKYYKIYTHGYENVSHLRERLMTAKSYQDVYDLLK